MKHLKTLGLAPVAIVALTAMVGVSSAGAAEFHTAAGTTVTGVQTTAHVFQVTGPNATCTSVVYSGTASASGTGTTQSLHPETSGCTAFGLSGNANTAGCQYNFNTNLNTVNLSGCTNGIEIDSSSIFGHCHMNLPNQNGIDGQSFSNMGATAEGNGTLTETTAASNIDVTVNISNGVCARNGIPREFELQWRHGHHGSGGFSADPHQLGVAQS